MVVASMISGFLGKKGGDAAAEAAMSAVDYQKEANEKARIDSSSWREAGRAAIDEALQLMGLGSLKATPQGDVVDPTDEEAKRTAARSRFRHDPDFLFRQSEGEKSINRSMAARGGALSGAAVKAGMRFNQDNAAGAYKNYFDRLTGMSGMGGNAAGQTGALTVQGAGLVGNDYIRAGQARQSGYNALASGVIRADNQLEKGFSKLFSFGAFG